MHSAKAARVLLSITTQAGAFALLLMLASCAASSRTAATVAPAVPEAEAPTHAPVGIADTEFDIWPDPADRSVVRMRELQRFLADYHEAHGTYPATVAEIYPPRGRWLIDYEHDGWNQQFRYRTTAGGYELRSAGADRRFGTADDVVATHLT